MSNASESSEEIAEKIRTGEFFRESIQAYHQSYHDPMTDRYFFIGVTAVSLVILILAFAAIVAIYPLSKDVPFIYYSDNLVSDILKMAPLGDREDDANYLLKTFLTTNYLRLREGYSVTTVDRNQLGVQSQSSDQVFSDYQQLLDPRNAESPITKFQRNAVRRVEPLTYLLEVAQGDAERMIINYRERVISGTDVSSRRRRAIITFRFNEIKVDQSTGETSEMNFLVTGYKTEAAN